MDDDDTPAAIEQRVREGHWPSVTEVQTLLGVASRSTVHRWIEAGELRYRVRSVGRKRRHRQLHPEDVLGLLEQRRQVHREDGGQP